MTREEISKVKEVIEMLIMIDDYEMEKIINFLKYSENNGSQLCSRHIANILASFNDLVEIINIYE